MSSEFLTAERTACEVKTRLALTRQSVSQAVVSSYLLRAPLGGEEEEQMRGEHSAFGKGSDLKMDCNSSRMVPSLGNRIARLGSELFALIPSLLNFPSQLTMSISRSSSHMCAFSAAAGFWNSNSLQPLLQQFSSSSFPQAWLSIRTCQVFPADASVFRAAGLWPFASVFINTAFSKRGQLKCWVFRLYADTKARWKFLS